ncbi:YtxH domain-containing protein [Paucilactobacillus kaifaensis]|uniref:YtxH domain-containing protein n=1 Tax=Paucilactobacillus kaifaensis TaxID=2559921 RepID=UPI0010F5EB64|nr:YtxH domain-containing protein [Paucilactobacillus kaifaensis]
MAKGFLIGLTLGGVAAAAAAHYLLTDEQKDQLKQKVRDTSANLKDQVIDYALYAQDAADDLISNADQYKEDAQSKVRTASEKLKAQKDQVVDHFSNDHFEEQTASIREQLASAVENEDDVSDDIVIDKTDSDDEIIDADDQS